MFVCDGEVLVPWINLRLKIEYLCNKQSGVWILVHRQSQSCLFSLVKKSSCSSLAFTVRREWSEGESVCIFHSELWITYIYMHLHYACTFIIEYILKRWAFFFVKTRIKGGFFYTQTLLSPEQKSNIKRYFLLFSRNCCSREILCVVVNVLLWFFSFMDLSTQDPQQFHFTIMQFMANYFSALIRLLLQKRKV